MIASAQSAAGLGRIGQIHVTVRNLARATKFYRDSLGVPFLFQVPHMAFFDCGGTRLMLGEPETPEGPVHASILYFSVPDIQDAYAALSGRGVEFAGEPHLVAKMETYDLWMAFFKDSEGNTMAVMSEVAHT